jgi:hypothetical protein
MRPQVRLVTFAWGRDYVDDLLEFALPAALAPGNLPALADQFDCSAVIITEEALFGHVRAHPSVEKLERLCPVTLVPLDDLLSEPWQYGITIAHVLVRGMADLGPNMTRTYFLFLNADFVLADGCYNGLIGRIRSGEPVHLAPSYCTVAEKVRPLLAAMRDRHGGILPVAPRDMAGLVLSHPHNTLRAKFVNQASFEFEHADQFYWQVDAYTLIGHQMPIAVVGMRPEREVTRPGTFWDWGTVYDFCPSRKLSALGDSDDFMMLELRSGRRSIDSIRFGRSSPKHVARRLTGHMTQYQRDSAAFDLVLHSRALPDGLTAARRKLRAHVDDVLRHLPAPKASRPADAQWPYHQRHYRDRLERKAIGLRIGTARAAIDRLDADAAAERALIDEHLSNGEREQALRALEAELQAKLEPCRGALDRLERELEAMTRPATVRAALAAAPHAYRTARRRLVEILRESAAHRPPHVLIVCSAGSHVLQATSQVPATCLRLGVDSIASGALQLLPAATPKFDACVVELSHMPAARVRDVLEDIAGRMKRPATMLLYWHDQGSSSLLSLNGEIVGFALDHACRARTAYAGSWASAWAAGALRRAKRTRGVRRWLAMAAFAPLSLLAELTGVSPSGTVDALPRHCSAAIFALEMLPRLTVARRDAVAAGPFAVPRLDRTVDRAG